MRLKLIIWPKLPELFAVGVGRSAIVTDVVLPASVPTFYVRCATRMGIFPITPLVDQVQQLIFTTFVVSEQAAQDCAAELVALAEGWGSPGKTTQMDWPFCIKKSLGEKLRWRSETDHAQFQASQKQKHQAYEALIRNQPHV